MPANAALPALTPALEDYLESVFRLVTEHGFARVRDIAEARGVKPGSVSPAMRRLEEAGLIRYERREYVALTDTGAAAARRIYSRHRVLRRFFGTFLGLPPEIAEADACVAEHSLSAATLDRLVRLFEYMEVCPDGRDHLRHFHQCSRVQEGADHCPHHCPALHGLGERNTVMSVADLRPGQKGRVRQIEGQGAIRQRLLDMGILPDTTIELARIAPTGDPMWIRLQGFELALRKNEAAAVLIEAL
ncbi:MAG: DtxR family transcriptional regulator [Krumholzibacteria bacterium]|nr:DtxR family transcriptional regulator [Candidatus Krumholzibacteria bacterium]